MFGLVIQPLPTKAAPLFTMPLTASVWLQQEPPKMIHQFVYTEVKKRQGGSELEKVQHCVKLVK